MTSVFLNFAALVIESPIFRSFWSTEERYCYSIYSVSGLFIVSSVVQIGTTTAIFFLYRFHVSQDEN